MPTDLLQRQTFRPRADELLSAEVLVRKYGSRRPALVPVCLRAFKEALDLITPVCAFSGFHPGEVEPVSSRLPGAHMVVLGVCTIGPRLEDRSRSLFEEDPVAAVILDEIGNKLVGEVARHAHLALRAPARERGWRVGPAFRPGIGHWPVAFQPLVLELLAASELGITLTGGLMMVPQKSISFVAAMGPSLARSAHP